MTNELPGMTGTEVASAVVALDERPEVIVVTSDERSRNDAFDAGALAVAERFDVEGLEAAIANAKFLFVTGERRVAARPPQRRRPPEAAGLEQGHRVSGAPRTGARGPGGATSRTGRTSSSSAARSRTGTR